MYAQSVRVEPNEASEVCENKDMNLRAHLEDVILHAGPLIETLDNDYT